MVNGAAFRAGGVIGPAYGMTVELELGGVLRYDFGSSYQNVL